MEEKMKKSRIYWSLIALLFIAGTIAFAQQAAADRATVPFSDPSKPGLLEASAYNGGITVKGYSGNEVIVEAKARGTQLKEKEKEPAKAKGMQRITVNRTGLVVEEKNNVMEVRVTAYDNTVDLTIQVPFKTSLKLGSYENGDIVVENVNGEIEAASHEGSVTLKKISGSAVVHAYDGSILVDFEQTDPEKPMSFASYDGDIDVTFPAALKANVKMRTQEGEIFSDFQVDLKTTPQQQVQDERKKGGKYRISFGEFIYGTINGGGPEFQFETYDGNIYIRKK
jgi:DUF4097 and DUF4098 domain-containing protein YvlB